MGLRTALLLTVLLTISWAHGKRPHKTSPSLRMTADGSKSMEVIKKQAAYLSNKDKTVTKGPPCDKEFSWTYVRPGTSMKIRSRWLGKAMNFPDICGWSFWTEGGKYVLKISCGSVDIRDTDHLMAWDYDKSEEIGSWQGETIEDFKIGVPSTGVNVASTGIAFVLESNQVRDKRSFECTVTSYWAYCGAGNNIGWFDCGDGECVPLYNRCDGGASPACANGADESEELCGENAPPCGGYWHTCPSDGECISPDYICDGGIPDCNDNTDELNCPAHGCVGTDLVCSDGTTCVGFHSICNGPQDCDDGEDEEGCGPNGTSVCPGGYFRCNTGECKPDTFVCDGSDVCDDGEDEVGCVLYGRDSG